MALYDVSKNELDRSSPQPNHSDQIIDGAVKAHSTTSIHPVTDATTTSGYLQTKNGRILGNDGTNNVGLFGFDDAGNMVVKVAKPGYDANTATNDQLIFNSSQDVFKIVATGTLTIPAANLTWTTTNQWVGNSSSTSVAHGLSFTPLAAGAVLVGSQYSIMPSTQVVFTSIPIFFQIWMNTDGTNLYAGINSTGFSGAVGASTFAIGPYTLKYYLLQETAN